MGRADDLGDGRAARINIKVVAERAGVGVGSVSRVLSGKGAVSPEMLERVNAAAASLGYEPDFLAQALRSRSTRTVGFLISDITNPLLAALVSGAEAVLSRARYSVLLTSSGGRPEVDAERIRLLLQRQVDGLIALPASETDPATVKALAAARVPVVLIDREMADVPDALSVLSDHRAGISEATRYLLGCGRRRIALLAGPPMRPARERIKAFEGAHAAVGATPFVIEHGALSVERGRIATAQLLNKEVRPDAIILGGNQLLEGALDALRIHNLDSGGEVALACCDDVPIGRLVDPPLPTVCRDTEGLGRAAAELLLDRLSGKPAGSRLLPTWFEPRGLSWDRVRERMGSGNSAQAIDTRDDG